MRRAAAPRIVQAQERDHVVLVDAVARDADAADQRAAAIDRHAAGEDLDAVLQPVLAGRGVGQVGAARRRVGRRAPVTKPQVLDEVA